VPIPCSLRGRLGNRDFSEGAFWYTNQIRYFNEAVTSTLEPALLPGRPEIPDLYGSGGPAGEPGARGASAKGCSLTADTPPHPPALLSPGSGTHAAESVAGILYARAHRHQPFLFSASGAIPIRRAGGHQPARDVPLGDRQPRPQGGGGWLDIGCGREGGCESPGWWGRGHRCRFQPDAIRQCRESGLQVTESDALAFLQSAAMSRSPWSARFTFWSIAPRVRFEFVYQMARTLKPGGVLLVETLIQATC